MNKVEQLKMLLGESVAIIKQLHKENENLKKNNERMKKHIQQLGEDLAESQREIAFLLTAHDKAAKRHSHFDSEKLSKRIKHFTAHHPPRGKLTVGNYNNGKWET